MSNVMTKDNFIVIYRCLHLVDDNLVNKDRTSPNYDKLYKCQLLDEF